MNLGLETPLQSGKLSKPDDVPVIKTVLSGPLFVIKNHSFRLLDREGKNYVIRDAEVIIKGHRASVKSSRYFHGDDDFPIVVLDGEGFKLEFVFLDRFHNPALDALFSMKFHFFVADERIVRKTGKNGLYIVLIARIDILFNDSRQFDRHDNSPLFLDHWNGAAVNYKLAPGDG